MIAPRVDDHSRTALAFEFELEGGSHGASARVELLDWDGAPARRIVRVTLRGRLGGAARRRLERAFRDLAARDVDHVVLDCSAVERLGGRVALHLIHAAARIEARAGAVEVCGLPDHLSRRLSTAGVRCWPARAAAALGPMVEYAS